jgi:hypothetical protein
MALLGASDEARLVLSLLKVEIRIYDDNTSFSRVISVKLRQHSSLHGVLAELGVIGLLLGSLGGGVSLVSGELSSGGTGSSNSQVVRGVSGLGESILSGGASHFAEDGEDLSDVLAYGSDSSELDLGSGGNLADTEGSEFFLFAIQNIRMSEISKGEARGTYSLEEEFFEADFLVLSSKFMGLDTVHKFDNN